MALRKYFRRIFTRRPANIKGQTVVEVSCHAVGTDGVAILMSVKPSDNRIETQADNRIPVPKVQVPASLSHPAEDSTLEEPKTKQSILDGSETSQKSPATSHPVTAPSLLMEACQKLSEDEKVLG